MRSALSVRTVEGNVDLEDNVGHDVEAVLDIHQTHLDNPDDHAEGGNDSGEVVVVRETPD